MKKQETVIDNLPIRTYVEKRDNRTTFKKLSNQVTIKLLGSTINKITDDENGKNIPHLENTELVLVYCNIVNNEYQHNSRVLYTLFPDKLFGQLSDT